MALSRWGGAVMREFNIRCRRLPWASAGLLLVVALVSAVSNPASAVTGTSAIDVRNEADGDVPGVLEVQIVAGDGPALTGGCVTAHDSFVTKNVVGQSCTSADGVYRLTFDNDTSVGGFALVGFPTTLDRTFGLGTSLRIRVGETVQYQVAIRATGDASVTVNVTLADGQPATAGCVSVVPKSGLAQASPSDTDCTSDGGEYVISGLADGEYIVKAADFDTAIMPLYYGPSTNEGAAIRVAISDQQSQEIDFHGRIHAPAVQPAVGRVTFGT